MIVEGIAQDVSNINFSAVVTEVNLVGSNPNEWRIDMGATRHVCVDRSLFSTF